jgi:hypothetical protein
MRNATMQNECTLSRWMDLGLEPIDVALSQSSDRYGKFDQWSHDVGNQGFYSYDLNPYNHYTVTPLVINQVQLD